MLWYDTSCIIRAVVLVFGVTDVAKREVKQGPFATLLAFKYVDILFEKSLL